MGFYVLLRRNMQNIWKPMFVLVKPTQTLTIPTGQTSWNASSLRAASGTYILEMAVEFSNVYSY